MVAEAKLSNSADIASFVHVCMKISLTKTSELICHSDVCKLE